MGDSFLVPSLQDVIRHELRIRSWSYRDLATAVGVAEVTIKRWMTADDLSLQRVIAIAGALDLTPLELLERADRGRERSFVLDEQTERALVAEPQVHVVWDALRLGHSPAAVAEHYGIDGGDWLRVLGRLESLGLAELHPGGRLRFLHHGIHNWLREGPLWVRYQAHLVEEVREALTGSVPSVVQAATRVVGPDFWAEAEEELLALARRWRDRAWRDQKTVAYGQQRRVRWTLVLADAPRFPSLPM